MTSNLNAQDTCASLAREALALDRVRWIFRNDQPAMGAVAHAYYSGQDVSVCGEHDRSDFDWTELAGDRCGACLAALNTKE